MEYVKKQANNPTVEKLKPLMSINDRPIIYEKTIVIIKGNKGCHKSHIAESIASAAIARKGTDIGNFLSLKRHCSTPIEVHYFDTERTIHSQFPAALKRIYKNAGYIERPDELVPCSLVMETRIDRINIVQSYLEMVFNNKDASQVYKERMLLIFDIITDCAADFNSLPSSLVVVDTLNLLVNKFPVSIVVVIHENNSSEKSEGHLGTQLEKKASSVLRSQKHLDDTGSTYLTISIKKQRDSEEDNEPIYTKFDGNTLSLRIIPKPASADTGESNGINSTFQNAIRDFFTNNDEATRDHICQSIGNIVNMKPDTVARKLMKTASEEIIIPTDDGEKVLKNIKKGRETYYILEDLN
ncbi:hypothetical protein [Chitinophaga eiseniae]|uniref:AAA domain-containing protein n=1 Tax=Chitinophaga eiseniae TaxID=634771 RepID=A0A847SKV0_9BACT|nr:hypothetical protein [Chitinophaga eiseniae]NLR78016.1 hypothetical protein [Chitinophaga eiseniae]